MLGYTCSIGIEAVSLCFRFRRLWLGLAHRPQDKKDKEKEKANDEIQDVPETSLGAELKRVTKGADWLKSPRSRVQGGYIYS